MPIFAANHLGEGGQNDRPTIGKTPRQSEAPTNL
jgi:hypothetical protein